METPEETESKTPEEIECKTPEETESKPPEETIKCFICQMEINRLGYSNHYFDCRRKNTIRALDVRRNQTYIKDGKKYRISEIEHVFRRGNHRAREVNALIVQLYCDEDQTSIRMAFRWDRRFIVDKNNNILIPTE